MNNNEVSEQYLGSDLSKGKKFWKRLSGVQKISKYLKDKDDIDDVQKAQLSKFQKQKSSVTQCWDKFNDSTIKLRSIVTNIVVNTVDTITDAVAAKFHYR